MEAKSSRKPILEGLKTDFGPQDSDLGGQDSNVGGQKWRSVIYDEDFWTRSAACARPIAKLESSGYSWSTEKFHTPAILSGCGGFLRSARPAEAAIAKVFAQFFAKIRQKILFCKFFGRAGCTGTSRTTSCQNFSLERALAVPKTSKKRKTKKRSPRTV